MKITMSTLLWIFLAFLMIFIMADTVAYCINTHDSWVYTSIKHIKFSQHIENAKRFYSNQSMELATDEYILFSRIWPHFKNSNIITKYPHDPFLRIADKSTYDEKFTLLRKVHSKRSITNIIGQHNYAIDNYFYTVPATYSHYIIDPVDDVLLKSLYCDKTGYSDIDYQILSLLRDNVGGYIDTHYLISLLFLKELDCYDKVILDTAINLVAQTIISEQTDTTVFSDLFAERVVVLYWAGYGDSIQSTWIDLITKAQHKDGSWSDKNTILPNTHTTNLSALAIKYFIAGKEMQPIIITAIK